MRLLLPLLLLACTDEKTDDAWPFPDDGGHPDVLVEPTSIGFGDRASGSSTDATVTVTNLGDASLEIRSLALEDDSAPYSLSAIGAVLVVPGSSTTFTVTYAPAGEAGADTRILLVTNDPDEPEVAIPLSGAALVPRIELSPESYDLGTIPVACEETTPISIRSVGTADLVVSDLAFVTASADLVLDTNVATNGPLPWTLPPGTSMDVLVTYLPMDDYVDEGFVTVSSNDPFHPEATASVAATGTSTAYVDVFEQATPGLVDIVVAMDGSEDSMPDDMLRVTENLDTLVAALWATEADWRLAVVMADDGCVAGSRPYMDGSLTEEELSDTLEDMLAGTPGEYTEKGFTVLDAALSSSNLAVGGCNEGVVREPANLAIIGVTDEMEQSPSPWSFYLSIFQALKTDPDDVIMHAVAGDFPSGCGTAEAGSGWYEVTVATGGQFLSICATDWATHLEDVGGQELQDSFELTQWPVSETITVTVDGVRVTEGWTYNSTDRSLDFDEAHIPEAGAIIEVAYGLYGDCDE